MSNNNNRNRPPASVIFIFGGSGDLNQRKLTPALYNLFLDEWLPEKFAVVGLGRTPYDDAKFKEHLYEAVQEFSRRKGEQNGHWKDFSNYISYLQMDAEDADAYHLIANRVKEFETEFGEHPNVIFYLAVAPQLVPDIATKLGA